jgi:hypothetical protein
MSRARHIIEFRHAIANNCSLDEARRQLARLDWLATENRLRQRIDIRPFSPHSAVKSDSNAEARKRTRYGYDD